MFVEEDKLLKVHHDWMLDILKRMKAVMSDTSIDDHQKLAVLEYWIKQALKVERED